MMILGYSVEGYFCDESSGKDIWRTVKKDYFGKTRQHASEKVIAYLQKRWDNGDYCSRVKIVPIIKKPDGTLNGKPVYTPCFDYDLALCDHLALFQGRVRFSATLYLPNYKKGQSHEYYDLMGGHSSKNHMPWKENT